MVRVSAVLLGTMDTLWGAPLGTEGNYNFVAMINSCVQLKGSEPQMLS